MFKIEQSLLIKKPNVELSLMSIINQYYKEMHMLISNIHLTHVMMQDNVSKIFPLETNKYDGAWYKNILVASNIIFDRLHMVIDPSIQYDEVFKNEEECNFKSLATVWNKINFIVKYNMNEVDWKNKVKEWNIIATSRKLEELISTGVKINQPLLESIEFDVEKYKSVPKQLDATKNFEFDNLVNVLKGEEKVVKAEKIETESTLADLIEEEKALSIVNEESKNNVVNNVEEVKPIIINPRTDSPLPQPQQQTITIEPKPEIEASLGIEKKPVSPVKKEMDQILRWISTREVAIKSYKSKLRLGYDPEELKRIEAKLKDIANEQSANDLLIAEAKKLIPPHAKKAEMDAILRWINSKNQEISKFKKLLSGSAMVNDSERLEKAIDNVKNEIQMIDGMISEARSFLPKDPMIKEMAALLRWTDARKSDINAYKRKLAKEDNINDELKLIEKEMVIVDKRIDNISNQIVIANKNRPIDPLKSEMDEILKWIEAKEKDILLAKKELNKYEKELNNVLKLKSDVEKELEEITGKLNFAEQDLDILKKQQNVIEAIDNIDKKIENTSDKSSTNLVVKKHVNDKSLSTDDELDRINQEMELVKKKYNKITTEYEAALQKYKVEVKILQTAFEVLPKSLHKIASSNVDKMIDHLLEEGYIRTDEEKENEAKKEKPILVRN